MQAFEETFHKRGIKINKKVMFDENSDANSLIQSGLLNELSNNARSFFHFLNRCYINLVDLFP
ncbi:hypothetical protein KIN20_016715 [Parelaphostrongylus tenuis]|uniref:Uncharacterized protein n=1 Tax=Parelaphostrongylus tenuis TaxID=148309 RepID=A0AAD5MKE2_PARTN|nr:hypothetical protein KIN20_016715 [Parelaphostrongylus tenuis]